MMQELESVILTILTATSLNHYIELALTSEPAESCIEVSACESGLLLKFCLSHFTVCVERIPNKSCVVSNVVDFYNCQIVLICN